MGPDNLVRSARPWFKGTSSPGDRFLGELDERKPATWEKFTENFIWNLAHAPIEINAPASKIPAWKIVNDVAPQPVTDRGGVFRGEVNKAVEKYEWWLFL